MLGAEYYTSVDNWEAAVFVHNVFWTDLKWKFMNLKTSMLEFTGNKKVLKKIRKKAYFLASMKMKAIQHTIFNEPKSFSFNTTSS